MTLLFVGCFAPDDARVTSTKEPIIGGGREEGFVSAGYLVRDGTASCSASLIEPDLVLTAAHCVESNIKHVSFGWGEVTANTTVGVVARALHPHYIPPPSNAGIGFQGFDVALLRLERPAGVEPVAIEQGAWTRMWSPARAVGYGATAYVLHPGAKLEPTGVGTERKSAEGRVIGHNPTELFVRFDAGTSPCYGDSGSPLLTDDGKIVGVLSRFTGPTRCRVEDHTPMAYTRVDTMEHFLREAKQCLRTADVAGCLREDDRGLCAAPNASNRGAPGSLVPEDADLGFGSKTFHLSDDEERSFRTEGQANVKLTVSAVGDALMDVLPVGQNEPIAEHASEVTLPDDEPYEVVVRSCNGKRQTVMLTWQR